MRWLTVIYRHCLRIAPSVPFKRRSVPWCHALRVRTHCAGLRRRCGLAHPCGTRTPGKPGIRPLVLHNPQTHEGGAQGSILTTQHHCPPSPWTHPPTPPEKIAADSSFRRRCAARAPRPHKHPPGTKGHSPGACMTTPKRCPTRGTRTLNKGGPQGRGPDGSHGPSPVAMCPPTEASLTVRVPGPQWDPMQLLVTDGTGQRSA